MLPRILPLLMALLLLLSACSAAQSEAPEVMSPAQADAPTQAEAPAEKPEKEEAPKTKLSKLEKKIEEHPENTEQLLTEEYGSVQVALNNGGISLCRTAIPHLIENGYFEGEYATDYMMWHSGFFFNCVDMSSPDTVLEGLAFVRDNITPLLVDMWGESIRYDDERTYRVDTWATWPNWVEDLPLLPEEVTVSSGAAPKYLFLRRAQGGDEPQNWCLDIGLQTSLPAEFAPAALADVTHLILIDTVWEYDFSYSDGTPANKAISTITVQSAEGETTLSPVESRPGSVVPYFGAAPTAINTQIWLGDIYNSIAEELGFYA